MSSSDASIAESLNLSGGKTRGFSEVSQPGGGSPASPGNRSSGAGRKAGRRARTPAPPDAVPGLRRCSLDGWREGHPRPKYLRPPSRGRRGRCRYRSGLSGSGTSSSAATEKPRRERGEGRRCGRPRSAPPPPLGSGLS